jgi:hypothetical protein
MTIWAEQALAGRDTGDVLHHPGSALNLAAY